MIILAKVAYQLFLGLTALHVIMILSLLTFNLKDHFLVFLLVKADVTQVIQLMDLILKYVLNVMNLVILVLIMVTMGIQKSVLPVPRSLILENLEKLFVDNLVPQDTMFQRR